MMSVCMVNLGKFGVAICVKISGDRAGPVNGCQPDSFLLTLTKGLVGLCCISTTRHFRLLRELNSSPLREVVAEMLGKDRSVILVPDGHIS